MRIALATPGNTQNEKVLRLAHAITLLARGANGKTRVRLLHSGYVYDVLLLTLGLPFVLTFAAVVSHRFEVAFSLQAAVYNLATFIFMLAVALMTFRLAFSFARWLLPYVEFAPQKQPLERRIRAFFAVLTLGSVRWERGQS
jgi:hypothetical protein